jgi:hypothetical protein
MKILSVWNAKAYKLAAGGRMFRPADPQAQYRFLSKSLANAAAL